MRFPGFLVFVASVLLVACERRDDSGEVGQIEIPVIEVSAESYGTFAQFLEDAFIKQGSLGAKIAIKGESASEFVVIHRILGYGADPEVSLTIYPCLGGFCMDESWPASRGSELHHRTKSNSEMKHAILQSVERAKRSYEEPAFCVFYDADTDWRPVYEILHTMIGAGARSVTFEELPADEHLSKGVRRKVDSLMNGSSVLEGFQYDTKDYAHFDKLLNAIETEIVGMTATIAIRHGEDSFDVKVAPLPEICAAFVCIKGRDLLSGDGLTPIELPKAKEMFGYLAQRSEISGIGAGILLFAFDGSDMDTGVSVMRAMSDQGVQLWFSPPQKEKPIMPMGKKPSSPTGG